MTLNTIIDTDELEEVAKLLGLMDDVAARHVRPAVHRSLDLFETAVASRTPVNQGTLRASYGQTVTGSGVSLSGVLSTPLSYGEPVEFGRSPGKQPPREAIKLWVVRKLGLSGDEADSAAFLIARAIGRRGTKGAFMFRDGFSDAMPSVDDVWDDVPRQIVEEFVRL